MLIESVQLINIRSYAQQEVRFRSGVNFISGQNGAGKTTIIEAIGWALFGAAPAGTIEENLRYGTKKGEITVVFRVGNERFSILKKIAGSASTRRIYDATGNEIDLHGEKDINDFMKELLHIACDEDLSALFNDVIGVRQGSFTQPFLEAPGDRKRIFNKVLRLDSYAKAERNSADLRRLTETKIYESDKEYALLSQATEDEEPTRVALAEIEDLIQMNQIAVEKFKKEQVLAQAEVDKHKVAKDTLLKKQNAIVRAKAQLEAVQSSVLNKTKEWDSAMKAKLSLDTLFESYAAYLAAKEQDRQLNINRIERDGLEKKRALLDSAIATEIKAIELERKNNDHLIHKNMGIRKQGEEVLLQLIEQKAQFVEKGNSLKAKKSEIDQAQKNLNALEVTQKNFNKLKENLSRGLGKLEMIENDIKEIQDILKSEGLILNNYSLLLDAEKEEQATLKEITALQQQIKTLVKDHERFKTGRCPYTEDVCNTVGSLQEKTTKKIESIKLQMDLLNEKENTYKLIQNKYGSARLQHMRLDEAKKKLSASVESRDVCFEGFRTLFVLINKFDLEDSSYQEFRNAKDTLNDSLSYVQLKMIESIMECANAAAEQEIQKARSSQESYVKSWTEHYTQLNADISRIEQETQRILKEIDAARTELDQSEKIKMQLRIREDSLNCNRIEIDNLVCSLKQYLNLEQDIESVRLAMAYNEAAYEQYMGQSSIAEKLPILEIELDNLKKDLMRANVQIQDLQIDLESAEKAYSADAEKETQEMLSTLRDQYIESRTRLSSLEQNRDEFLQKLERMLLTKSKKIETAAKLASLQKTQELLRLCLKVLKDAGERMAQVYRQRLTIEADRYYRAMSADASLLQWTDDYDIRLIDTHDEKERRRVFRQLSGGEQMTAALALRLALLTQLSSAGIAFFDEPTTNLDIERRTLLADVIPAVTREFEQIFVVSHDDTFDSITENIISLRRGSNGTQLDTRI